MMGAKTISFALLLIASQLVADVRGQDDDDIPRTKEEIRAFLGECVFFGELGAAAAASAACDVVLNKCPKASFAVAKIGTAEAASAKTESKSSIADDLIKDRLIGTLRKSCETTLLESCARNAFLVAQENPDLKDCFDILSRGPGIPNVAEFCPSDTSANCLFEAHVDNICGRTEVPDVSKCEKLG